MGVRVSQGMSKVSVASVLERSYRHHSHRPALCYGDTTFSYAELGDRVHRIVSGLQHLNARVGDRVAILSANRPEFIEVSHAVFVGGFVRLTPSNKLHVREVAEILEDCRATVVFVGPEWVEILAAVRSELTSLKTVIAFDGVGGDLSYDELLATGSPDALESLPSAEDLCALLYTSGTTGRPKGAGLTHANWAAMIRNSLLELPSVGADDIILHVAPLSHFSGYVEPTYSVRGALHVVDAPFDAHRSLKAIERHRVTAVPLVPTMLNMLVEAAETGQYDLSSVRSIVYGGSGIAPHRLARAVSVFGDVFTQFFGLSEAPMPLSALSPGDHRFDPSGDVPDRLASAGRVSPFVELRICDDSGNQVLPGAVGEIVVRGDAVMSGYWERPKQTAEMIDSEGWAATGDLGRLDEDGYLYVVDRKRDMIVTGGYNVYPNEVENAIAALSDVREVAVVGAPDDRWGEAITAVVVLRPGSSLSEDRIIAACRDRLAEYKKPRVVKFVDELPKTGSGKIMRRQIRDQFWSDRKRRVG